MGAAVALSWGCCENVVCAHVCKHSIDVQWAAASCHVAVLQVLQSRSPAVCGNLNIIVEAHGDPPFLPPSSAPASSLAPCWEQERGDEPTCLKFFMVFHFFSSQQLSMEIRCFNRGVYNVRACFIVPLTPVSVRVLQHFLEILGEITNMLLLQNRNHFHRFLCVQRWAQWPSCEAVSFALVSKHIFISAKGMNFPAGFWDSRDLTTLLHPTKQTP